MKPRMTARYQLTGSANNNTVDPRHYALSY
jgi:hypothetical protein